jgi:hypothetical protein
VEELRREGMAGHEVVKLTPDGAISTVVAALGVLDYFESSKGSDDEVMLLVAVHLDARFQGEK